MILDINYRLPSRPDLLLKDLISVQYPNYDPSYTLTFLNENFAKGGSPSVQLTSADCPNTNYITVSPVQPQIGFAGDQSTPPAVVGSGIYGNGSQDNTKVSSNNIGVIVTVVCVAVVLVAGFGFIFFKWTRRAKEDRFIELEEEMNNEIPLR